MRRPWLRLTVSLFIAFVFFWTLGQLISHFAVFEYPPPPDGSWRAISANIAFKLEDALFWSAPAFHWLFPPVRGQQFTLQEFFGPQVVDVILITVVFYAGLTWFNHRAVRRMSRDLTNR